MMSKRTNLAASRTSFDGFDVANVTPFMIIRPPVGASSNARQRSSVVLPDPDGPIMPNHFSLVDASRYRLENFHFTKIFN
jgi:hypothetical protein